MPNQGQQDYLEWQAAGSPYGPAGFKKWLDNGKRDPNQMRASAVDPYGDIGRVGASAERFGQQGSLGYDMMTREMAQDRDYLRGLQRGENSVSAEQLRQGLQQNLSGMQSMASSARPGMQPMAARTAMIQGGRLGGGLAGQQALAGLQEQNMAAQNLASMNLGQRGQDMQAALGSNQAAGNLYLGRSQLEADRYKTDMAAKAERDKMKMGALSAGMGAIAMSDRRLKTDIEDGSHAADKLLHGLRAHAYRYKDETDGEGVHLGPMAQELEEAGLKGAVIETPRGKAVHGTKLALGLAAILPGIDQRLRRLESKD